MTKNIYLDANATGRLRPEVVECAQEILGIGPSNASSIHANGRAARAKLREASRSILDTLSLENIAERIVFTSGGTEACNLITLGLLSGFSASRTKGRIVCSAIEHDAIVEPVLMLEKAGWSVEWIPALANGRVDVEKMTNAVLSENTDLVLLMAANNETGAIQPIEKLSKSLRAQSYSGLICSDCTQVLGKSDISFSALFKAGVDAIAFSGHKIGAPAGVGCAIFSADQQRCRFFSSLTLGGPQQESFRAGTENILGISCLAKAVEVTVRESDSRKEIKRLRNLLWDGISNIAKNAQWIAGGEFSAEDRQAALIANTLLLRIPGLPANDLIVALDINGLSCSSGSACSSGKQTGSRIIEAMGLAEAKKEVIRLSLDWDCCEEDIFSAIAVFERTLPQFSKLADCSGENNSLAEVALSV